jgi:hypothetical protein
MTNKVHTYVINDGTTGVYKIGQSRDILKRVRSMQGQTSHPVKVIMTVEGRHKVELHKVYEHHRLHGEWFSIDDIETLKDDLIKLNSNEPSTEDKENSSFLYNTDNYSIILHCLTKCGYYLSESGKLKLTF